MNRVLQRAPRESFGPGDKPFVCEMIPLARSVLPAERIAHFTAAIWEGRGRLSVPATACKTTFTDGIVRAAASGRAIKLPLLEPSAEFTGWAFGLSGMRATSDVDHGDGRAPIHASRAG
ncbi:hypothetical protein [Methylobacterium nonmethylotrophicum]|uniref:Uncharacterized protein n=1 Tax=Methylobacterium nonmethylotrophicum TaxID=1141884 RepID=A0A4Z0NK89_9HYPH|nr:hypothetical protein [Methylobacterium nonmethylotrophicum]TGD96774.1 hypothetical protein EU555_22210 [Methylobacterium nonmethylotrophicum]